MATVSPSTSQRVIRIYCLIHKLGFDTVAAAAIQCVSGAHTLTTDFPNESSWGYCCDCHHFWAHDITNSTNECPVCERSISRRFLCDQCAVLSVESDNSGRRKAFKFIDAGTPFPSCPGCLLSPLPSTFAHQCQELGITFVTPRSICPFCEQALDPLPAFPCLASTYLRKAGDRTIKLEFQSSTKALTESSVGHYLLIENGTGSSLPIVIPGVARFNSKQEYYDTCFELFNCDNPSEGEVIILTPAIVEKTERGWLLREPGFIEIEPTSKQKPKKRTIKCPTCGTSASIEHTFCKHCGGTLRNPILQAPKKDLASPSEDLKPSRHVVNSYTDISSPAVDAPHQTFTATPLNTNGFRPSLMVLGIAAAVVVVGIAIIALVSSSNSVEAQLEDAITKGHLFSPSNGNAHDLYNKLKSDGANEETLRRYRERILPQLTNQASQLINQFMVPGNDEPALADWQRVSQALDWAHELKPADTSIKAQAEYCQGRVYFLSKEEDQALQYWTRAADSDKTWPLPVNGIGLIYFSRKNYAVARSYYLDAIRRNPNWAYPYNNMGTSFYMEKNYAQAKDYYRRAVDLASQWARPHSWLGDIAMKEQDFTTAVAEFEKVLDPAATGQKNIDLDRIRKQLEIARQHTSASQN